MNQLGAIAIALFTVLDEEHLGVMRRKQLERPHNANENANNMVNRLELDEYLLWHFERVLHKHIVFVHAHESIGERLRIILGIFCLHFFLPNLKKL